MSWLTAQIPSPALHSTAQSWGWLALTSHHGFPGTLSCSTPGAGTYLVPGSSGSLAPHCSSQPDLITAHAGHFVDMPGLWELDKTCRTRNPLPVGAAMELHVPQQILGLLAHLLSLPSLLKTREFSSPSRALSSPLALAPASLGEAAEQQKDESQHIYRSSRWMWGPTSCSTGTSGFYLHLPVQGH